MVGRQNGKTTLVAVRALAGMVLLGERRCSPPRRTGTWRWTRGGIALELAEDAGLEVHDVRRTNGQEEFWIGRARYKVVANTRRGGPWPGGGSRDPGRAPRVSGLGRVGGAGENAAGPARARKCGRSRTRATRVASCSRRWPRRAAGRAARARRRMRRGSNGPRRRSSSAPIRAAWAQANPALGHLITPATIASEAVHERPRYSRLRCCAGGWRRCGRGYRRACGKRATEPAASVPDGAAVVFALDAGPELRHATIGGGVAAAGRPGASRGGRRVRRGGRAGAAAGGGAAGRARGAVGAAGGRGGGAVAVRRRPRCGRSRVPRCRCVTVGPAELIRAANAFPRERWWRGRWCTRATR